jgi:hypothetical protein
MFIEVDRSVFFEPPDAASAEPSDRFQQIDMTPQRRANQRAGIGRP